MQNVKRRMQNAGCKLEDSGDPMMRVADNKTKKRRTAASSSPVRG
jgi:hypothetical protein